jgi:DNA-binding SARP family transcriptional activator
VYQRTRVVLAEELGIDPSPELQRLHQQILVQDPTLEAATAQGTCPSTTCPNGSPASSAATSNWVSWPSWWSSIGW